MTRRRTRKVKKYVRCPICGKLCKGIRGLKIHIAKAHKNL